MSARTTTVTRKGLAIATAGMFALSSMAISPPPLAVAQNEGNETVVSEDIVSQLSANDTAKLTIHKRAGNPSGTNQYGTELETAPGEPLAGAGFDVYKVNDIDLSTIEGWKAYDALRGTSPTALIEAKRVGQPVRLTTDSNGEASGDFAVGVYVVVENVVPAGYTGSVPFITALPFTTADGSGWNKDVHVYPKNQELTTDKTVQDQGQHAQNTITYTLGASVPPVPAAPQGTPYFDGFSLLDIYDPAKWTPDTESITAQIVAGTATTQLEAGDFQVSAPVAYTKETGKNAFTISLTASGLRKLENAARGNDPVRLEATVEGQLAADLVPGPLQNKMSVIPPNVAVPNWDRSNEPDDPNDPPEDPTPETEVESRFGQINVTKVSSRQDTTTLAGATFELHKCENNNTAGQPGKRLADSEALTINGANSWTTDAEGKFTITGIQLEDFYNGGPKGEATIPDEFDYCLVETKAPEGYELLPEPILVPVNTTMTAANYTLDSQIANVPTTTDTFRLPSTGEWGRWWLVGLGALAILAAAGVIVANNRRNDAA